mmetsp:Transcript_54221/g.150845  ORF Transcript_54221/g.150845 Transcript_54221/m.150845 type:complete len:244 (+) Transcript_54221:108-839(+)
MQRRLYASSAWRQSQRKFAQPGTSRNTIASVGSRQESLEGHVLARWQRHDEAPVHNFELQLHGAMKVPSRADLFECLRVVGVAEPELPVKLVAHAHCVADGAESMRRGGGVVKPCAGAGSGRPINPWEHPPSALWRLFFAHFVGSRRLRRRLQPCVGILIPIGAVFLVGIPCAARRTRAGFLTAACWGWGCRGAHRRWWRRPTATALHHRGSQKRRQLRWHPTHGRRVPRRPWDRDGRRWQSR